MLIIIDTGNRLIDFAGRFDLLAQSCTHWHTTVPITPWRLELRTGACVALALCRQPETASFEWELPSPDAVPAACPRSDL